MADRMFVPGLMAAESLATSQYKVVYLSATGAVSVCSNANEARIIGIVQNAPAQGEEATVVGAGYARAMAGEQITAGRPIACAAGGLVANVASGSYVIGRALEAAVGSGNIIDVFVTIGHALTASIG